MAEEKKRRVRLEDMATAEEMEMLNAAKARMKRDVTLKELFGGLICCNVRPSCDECPFREFAPVCMKALSVFCIERLDALDLENEDLKAQNSVLLKNIAKLQEQLGEKEKK